ncbi:MAG: 2-isopropylmalate synthase, partial [Calditrichaeota bacterium]
YTAAIRMGARRICCADTVGHATPRGAAAIIRFLRELVDEIDPEVKIDWHGHKDRGLSVANTLAAIEAGADRVHGSALGIGERCGNTPMEHILVNCKLLNWIDNDLSKLYRYTEVASRATQIPIPKNYPIVGEDAFRTGTGVHAAAIIKAKKKGDDWLADRVYSGVPASWFGRKQSIEIGPMSGESNIIYWLEEHGFEAKPEWVKAIFAAAKQTNQTLTEPEILQIINHTPNP